MHPMDFCVDFSFRTPAKVVYPDARPPIVYSNFDAKDDGASRSESDVNVDQDWTKLE